MSAPVSQRSWVITPYRCSLKFCGLLQLLNPIQAGLFWSCTTGGIRPASAAPRILKLWQRHLEKTNFRFIVQTKYRSGEANFRFIQTKYRLEQTNFRFVQTNYRLEQTSSRFVQTKYLLFRANENERLREISFKVANFR